MKLSILLNRKTDGDLILHTVVVVTKMGNIMPREGDEPISRAFRASVLIITPCKLPCYHHYTYAYLSMPLLASKVSAAY